MLHKPVTKDSKSGGKLKLYKLFKAASTPASCVLSPLDPGPRWVMASLITQLIKSKYLQDTINILSVSQLATSVVKSAFFCNALCTLVHSGMGLLHNRNRAHNEARRAIKRSPDLSLYVDTNQLSLLRDMT